MLIDELREKLKNTEADMTAIRTFWENAGVQKKFSELTEKMSDENFWQNPGRDQILAQHRKIKTIVEDYQIIEKNYSDYAQLIEMFKNNEQELELIKNDISVLCKKIAKFKIQILLNKEEDGKNCFLSINAGAGGTESQDWAQMLLRMYLRFCENENFRVNVLDHQSGDEAGIKSATIYIKGTNVFGLLKTEKGIHRLVRISPFDSSKRRHTSFAAVSVIPETEDEKIEINEADLRIDTFRAGGAGGQSVNKTESAVRITHIPTRIVVQCQNERSQLQNKQSALKVLRARILQKQVDEKRTKEKAIEKKKIEWGSQIRSYVLHPYKMVKDHRTEHQSPSPDQVLDGNLMPFIESYLLMESKA